MLRFTTLLLLCLAAALAGGFWITAHSPNSPLGKETPDAAVLIEVGGCANPKAATLAGTAEGFVDGRRKSVPLTFVRTSKPGVFAVGKQWTGGGAWVLAITGTYVGHNTGLLIEMGPKGEYRAKAVSAKELSARVEAALRST